MLTYAASLVAVGQRAGDRPHPDIQSLSRPGTTAPGPMRRLDDKPGMTVGMWQMRPLSHGFVEARSNRPGASADHQSALSERGADRRAVVGGLRWARRLFERRHSPVPRDRRDGAWRRRQTDDELLDYARQTGPPCFMRPAPARWVPTWPWWGTTGCGFEAWKLRVIDASVMPTVTSTNTNAPTIMIAEKGAAMMREGRGIRLGVTRIIRP